MSITIRDILAPLDPYWDRIIRRPLSSREVDDLEKKVGLGAPAPLREYLLAIGLFQDLTYWQASSIEVYDSPVGFVSARRFLREHLPPKNQDFFPFGDDGAGNVYCLPAATDGPCRIHFVDHETAKVSKGKEFDAWLQGVVGKVLRGIRQRIPNEHKVWAVQFSFKGPSYEELKSSLASAGKFREIDANWKNSETEDEVTSSERQIELNGARLLLSRMECADWKGPIHHFDMRERLATAHANAQIRSLHAIFKANFPGYRLVDYGPLDGRKLSVDEQQSGG